MTSFIKDYSALEENHKIDDLLDMGFLVTDFGSKIQNASNGSMLGLVGEYGSGKSTLLYHISKQKNDNTLWIEFDAWKFPDRKELWEGFILEFARHIDKNAFNEALSNVDGKQNDDKQALIATIASIPGLGSVQGLNHFFSTTSARRTFELQVVLDGLIDKYCKDKNIVLVIEDIDRSGDSGIFFLETLKHYLQTKKSKVDIKVIVPIATEMYLLNEDAYLKCLDIIEFYVLKKIGLSRFVNTVFKKEFLDTQESRRQVIQFLQIMIEKPGMTLRKLKQILRKADLNFKNQTEDGFEPDFRMSIMFEMAKFIFRSKEGKGQTYFDQFRSYNEVANGSEFSGLLQSIVQNSGSVTKKSSFTFKFMSRDPELGVNAHPSIPWTIDKLSSLNGTDTHFVCDFYMDY